VSPVANNDAAKRSSRVKWRSSARIDHAPHEWADHFVGHRAARIPRRTDTRAEHERERRSRRPPDQRARAFVVVDAVTPHTFERVGVVERRQRDLARDVFPPVTHPRRLGCVPARDDRDPARRQLPQHVALQVAGER
jgi:hypothetical protein